MSSFKAHFLVYGALLLLTGLTTAIAYVDLGVFNVAVALTIAVIKAVIVALFFMHLATTSHRTQVFAAAGVLWLLILVVFSLSDVFTRHLWSTTTRW
jgi:cytochrome c oxidase subunit 4